MKVLLDTNVLIDYISMRPGYYDNAQKILRYCMEQKIEGCIAAHSVMNTFYILRKEFSVDERKRILLGLCKILNVIGIDIEKIVSSLNNKNFTDVEDCLQSECAKDISADYIITRNIKDFENSEIKAISPDTFLEMIN